MKIIRISAKLKYVDPSQIDRQDLIRDFPFLLKGFEIESRETIYLYK